MMKLRAEYFTDPLCSWSWGNEPNYRKTRDEFGEQIIWQHRMGGLIENRNEDFYDPQYHIKGSDVKALAKHQEEVSLETQMPIDTNFWFESPPVSTFTICTAVKAAGLQGFEFEDKYLRRVREALLTERRPLNSIQSLIELAKEIPGMNQEKFSLDIKNDRATKDFQADWEAARWPVSNARDIKMTEGYRRYSFPTLLLYNDMDQYRVLDANHSYDLYLSAIKELCPTLIRSICTDIEKFVKKWKRVTTKEASVVCEVKFEEAEKTLSHLADISILRKRKAGGFHIWEVIDSQ